MNKRCRERETEILTERQIDFNINLWDVCSSGNPSDNSPCAIAIATGRPQWFAVQFIQATLIELSTRTLPRGARTLALLPSQINVGWETSGSACKAGRRWREDCRKQRKQEAGKLEQAGFQVVFLFSDSYTTSWSHPIKRTRKPTKYQMAAPSPVWCAERAWQGSRLASVLTSVCDASIGPRARGRQSRVLSWARLLNKLIKEQTLFQTNQKITRQL